MTWLRRFGAFWYDFLVGDRWELFLGPIVLLGIVAALVSAGVPGVLAGAVLFVGVVVVAAGSIAAVAP
jgi:hypothetical protein